MWSPKRKKGNIAEQLVKNFLLKQNLKLIQQNYLTKFGEIDLIMLEKDIINDTLVFVEVRYRKNSNYGDSVASVNFSKQQKIIKTSQIFLQQNPKYQDSICRFDIVGMQNSLKSADINWIKNAFYV